jgi:hypothetical protein
MSVVVEVLTSFAAGTFVAAAFAAGSAVLLGAAAF